MIILEFTFYASHPIVQMQLKKREQWVVQLKKVVLVVLKNWNLTEHHQAVDSWYPADLWLSFSLFWEGVERIKQEQWIVVEVDNSGFPYQPSSQSHLTNHHTFLTVGGYWSKKGGSLNNSYWYAVVEKDKDNVNSKSSEFMSLNWKIKWRWSAPSLVQTVEFFFLSSHLQWIAELLDFFTTPMCDTRMHLQLKEATFCPMDNLTKIQRKSIR
jgi:hypothetical protein